jgi:hypothetical protein
MKSDTSMRITISFVGPLKQIAKNRPMNGFIGAPVRRLNQGIPEALAESF